MATREVPGRSEVELPNRDVIIFVPSEDADGVAAPLADNLRRHGLVVLVIVAGPDSWTRVYDQVRAGARVIVFTVNKHCVLDESLFHELRRLHLREVPPNRLAIVHGLSDDLLSRCSDLFKSTVVIPTDIGLERIADLITHGLASSVP